MTYVTTKDAVQIYYKDWGPKEAQPLVFHHGWPLSADDWDAQLLFFLAQGYRVIAHDRRGHGRSSQVSEGHDMDHYAADASAVVEHPQLIESRARPQPGRLSDVRRRAICPNAMTNDVAAERCRRTGVVRPATSGIAGC